ncbi:type IV pilin protein [uncultured Ferrimonas sp.]|uniref:type IV pilin protein n=1 Tax=uncultured Ferrimonas sp. TaxID=432640 RepID=UPI00261157D8|nr:type IV pilin protein [uncultured Ferrimonas sp.]
MKANGFTLIEVMIAVVIVAIIASIAYPSYQSFVGRGYRGEAHSQLNRVANLQEQYYMDNRAFTTDLTQLGLATSPFETDSGRYKISATLAGGSYTLTAAAQGNQLTLDSSCTSLVLTMEGVKTPTECW